MFAIWPALAVYRYHIITLHWSLSQWPTGFLQYFDAVGWVIWPVKIFPEMTYKVLSGTLNLCSLTHYTASKTRDTVRTIAIDDSAVCQSICRAGGMCKNCQTDQHFVWRGDSWAHKKRWTGCRRWGDNSVQPFSNYFGHLLDLNQTSSKFRPVPGTWDLYESCQLWSSRPRWNHQLSQWWGTDHRERTLHTPHEPSDQTEPQNVAKYMCFNSLTKLTLTQLNSWIIL